jgi:predicted NUDIX family phosphoesterase
LKELSDEKLIVIPKKVFNKRLEIVGINIDRNQFKILERIIDTHSIVQRRSSAEEDQNNIQLVVCTVIKYNNTIAIFKKHEIKSDKRFHQKEMLWIGGHVHSTDKRKLDNWTLQKTITKCLKREIEEEIQLPVNTSPIFKGLVYDQTSSRSLQHLGIVFEINLKDINLYRSIDKKSFTELSGQSISVEFVTLKEQELLEKLESFESWSVDILKTLYNIDLTNIREERQLALF